MKGMKGKITISFFYLRALRLPCHLVGSKLDRAKPEASATADVLRGTIVILFSTYGVPDNHVSDIYTSKNRIGIYVRVV